jgi:hypothetical protein
MKTNAPKQIVWIIALILGLLGIFGTFIEIPIATEYGFWLLAAGWLLLIIATVTKGL